MLSGVRPESLARLRFPLAELTKPEVRELAAAAGLPVASKAESQDLCFLAGEGKRSFLARHGGLAERPGAIIDRGGRPLGEHRGHHEFTVGQRRGIGVGGSEPLYVLRTDAAANEVVVGTREELARRRVHVREATLHRPGGRVDRVPALPLEAARLRAPARPRRRARAARARARRARLRRGAGPDRVSDVRRCRRRSRNDRLSPEPRRTSRNHSQAPLTAPRPRLRPG